MTRNSTLQCNSSAECGLAMAAEEAYYNWGVICLSPIVLFGITGNVLVCMAVSMEKRLQSVTNYFLLSLAITDLLVCTIVMPFSLINEFVGYWPFSAALCNLYVTLDVLMCTSSILHLCTISLERYLAIRSPLATRNRSKMTVILKIVFLWTSAATISSPIAILGIVNERNILNDSICVLTNNEFILYGSICAFCVPLIIMVISYGLTIRVLHKQSKLCDPSHTKPGQQPIIRRSKSAKRQHRRRRQDSSGHWRSSGQQHSIEMDSRSSTSLRLEHAEDHFLQIPNIISQTSSTESLYTPTSSETTIGRKENGLLDVPSMHQIPGSSTESLLTSDYSTDEDTNQNSKSYISLQIPGNESTAQRMKHIVAKQIIVKASSILNLARDRNSDRTAVKTEQKASKVLGIVFFIFILCWAPFFTVNILIAVCKSCHFDKVLVTTFVWLGWISSTLNPIIYTMFNSTFKMTFVKLLKCQYGFLQKPPKRRPWGTKTGMTNCNTSSDSNAEIPL